MENFVLIVGLPGSGKTTLVERIRTWCPDRRVDGFITREVRDAQGQRVGFDLIDWLHGTAYPLARKAWTEASARVGRYGVRPEVLDAFVDRLTARNPTAPALWVLDEFGKMESFSKRFLTWLATLDLTRQRLVATGPVHPLPAYLPFLHRWRPDVWEITAGSRADVTRRLYAWLQAHGLVARKAGGEWEGVSGGGEG
jgi:nucleoside-triphosphatase THEP1